MRRPRTLRGIDVETRGLTEIVAIGHVSHVETIEPETVRTSSDFSSPRVEVNEDGSATVVAIAEMFRFEPETIRVPNRGPITFRVTSPDVIHGFQIVGTNVNLTVIPGYVLETTVTLPIDSRVGERARGA